MAKNPIKQIQVPGTTPTTYDIQDNTFVAGTNITITDNADGTRSINAEGSDSGITEITEANTKVYTLGSGIYKLSYNGTRTIQYTSSSSDKHTVVAKSDQPVYLYVSRNGYGGATDRWEWWYYSLKIYDGVYTSGTTPKIVRYGGWSVASNGGVYDPRVEELLQSAITDTTIANRVFLSTTNNGIGKWSDGNSFSSNGFLKIGDYGVVSVDSNSYATTSTVDGKAPKSHASTATTYGVGTTSNYGHVKTQTGDLNGTTSTDGVAAGLGHTHSQYLTSHQSIKTLNTNNSTAQTATSENIAGSGTISLHKVSKTGSYNDLLNQPTIPATNVIPATTTANKVLVSTTTSGTAKWSDFSSAGFLKTNASGVVSVDTNTYRSNTVTSGATAKRYLLGSSTTTSMATTSTNNNCYMQSGELYSNGNVVGTKLYEYNSIRMGNAYTVSLGGLNKNVVLYVSFTANVSSVTLASNKLRLWINGENTREPYMTCSDTSIKISNVKLYVYYDSADYNYYRWCPDVFTRWVDNDDESYTEYYLYFTDYLSSSYKKASIYLGYDIGYIANYSTSGTISGTAIN